MTQPGRSIPVESDAWGGEAGSVAEPTHSAMHELSQPASQADAFRRLADRRLDGAYRLARAILHDAADAEDATHDAFVTAWRSWATLRDPARFDAWFDRILVNVCRNRLRWAARHRSADLTAEMGGGGKDPYRATGDRDAIEQALRALSAEQRIVVVLRFYRDMQLDDIATWMGIPTGTVKSRLHHALRRLGTVMAEADMKDLMT